MSQFVATPLSPVAVQPEWMTRLIGVVTPAQVASTIVAFARAAFDGDVVLLAWSGETALGYRDETAFAPDEHDLRLAMALLSGTQAHAMVGDRLVLRLPQARAVVLACPASRHALPAALASTATFLQLAGAHLQHALTRVELQRSRQQLERSETLQHALFAISDLSGSDRDMPDMLRGIHAIVSTLMYAENFFIVRHDAEQQTFRFLYFVDVEEAGPEIDQDIAMRSREGTLTWHVLVGGKALMGSDEELERQASGPVIAIGPASVDWLGVPMLRDGAVHGALVVQSYREGIGFTAEDRAVLEFVGSHILTALEHKQSRDELESRVRLRTLELAQANQGLLQEVQERQRAERLQAALFHIAQLATADIDEGEFYERLHVVVGALLNAENFFIALLSDDRRILAFPYYIDAGQRRSLSREAWRGLSEYVLRSGKPLLCGQAQIAELARAGEIDPQRIGRPAVCWLGVPLRVGDEAIGLVAVQSYREDVMYGPADQELLGFVALQIANSIHRRRSAVSLQHACEELEQRVAERTQELREQILQRESVQDQLKHQVMHDALTGLPNRGNLRERIEQALVLLAHMPTRRCALLYLDVDRFKVINDSLGHLAGDEMLQEVARRLRRCVPEPDMVARLAGDEFAILLEDIRSPDTAQAVAQRVLETLRCPMQVAGRELEPSMSIGIAIGDDRYTMADELLRDADLALYRAKQLGRKRFELFDETLARDAIDVLTMEGELRHALQRDQFEPYFQPVFRLADHEVVGYEALLRWNHPLDGVIAPAGFLKVAQDSGHIEAIDWRVFELACRAIAAQRDRDLFLTINVSALHLHHGNFDQRLVRLLEHTGLAPARLVIEVTEGSLLDDPERVRALLERLRVAGVGAALDDFGTGYSSLSYLHSLPLRMLKVDRAFVHALDDGTQTPTTTVVAAILALARALDIQVIAEGIETETQRAMLLEMGCEFGQGFLLGRPAPMSETASRARIDAPASLPTGARARSEQWIG